MYIRRKVFSILTDEMDEERLYSVNETLFDEGYEYDEERMFSSDRKARKKIDLEEIESNKGLKRAIITALPTGGGSLVGGYLSKDLANKLDKAGASDKEIIRKTKKRGLEVGALTGAGIGGLLAIKTKSVLPLLAGASLGALGGRNASGVNVKDRLAKRALKEREENEKEFSKRDIIDEDFLEEHELRKKADRRGAKIGLTALGGVAGMYPGAYLGGGKGALIGAAAGAGLGYLGGRKLGKISDKQYDRLRRKYESASKKEKEYLRHKIEKELDRRNAREAAITAGYLAGRR